MPLWFFLAIAAAFLWTITIVTDRVVVSRLVTRAFIPVVINGLVALLVGIIIVLVRGEWPTWPYLAIILLAGLSSFIGSLFYYTAIKTDEASRVAPLFAFNVVWIPLGAALFLREIFDPIVYLSIGLIVIGSFLIMWRPAAGGGWSLKPVLLMLASTLAYAGNSLLLKYFLGVYGFWLGSALDMVGVGLGSLVLCFWYWQDVRMVTKKVGAVIVGAELINLLAMVVYTLAAASGFISFVSASLASEYIFIFLATLALSYWLPKILKEEFTPKILLLKSIATLLIVIGVVSVALSGK